MPVSKKRKIEAKEINEQHINIQESKFGKILLLILVISMVIGLLVTAIVSMIQEIGL